MASYAASNWGTLRKIGAAAHHMLIQVAANEWGVPAEECTAEKSYALHARTQQKNAYGNLANKAAT